jgi:hypothetical protein
VLIDARHSRQFAEVHPLRPVEEFEVDEVAHVRMAGQVAEHLAGQMQERRRLCRDDIRRPMMRVGRHGDIAKHVARMHRIQNLYFAVWLGQPCDHAPVDDVKGAAACFAVTQDRRPGWHVCDSGLRGQALPILKAEAGKRGQQGGQTGEIGESRYTASNRLRTRLNMAEQSHPRWSHLVNYAPPAPAHA